MPASLQASEQPKAAAQPFEPAAFLLLLSNQSVAVTIVNDKQST